MGGYGGGLGGLIATARTPTLSHESVVWSRQRVDLLRDLFQDVWSPDCSNVWPDCPSGRILITWCRLSQPCAYPAPDCASQGETYEG